MMLFDGKTLWNVCVMKSQVGFLQSFRQFLFNICTAEAKRLSLLRSGQADMALASRLRRIATSVHSQCTANTNAKSGNVSPPFIY